MFTDKRIEYIDATKGFAILWVIWWHTKHPDFIHPYFHVPLFFFLSGFFFKVQGNLISFIQKKINTMIVPIMFFMFCGYAEKLFLHTWDTKQISTFNFSSIFDIFVLGHTWTVNVPIWFLLSLLLIQIFMFIFCSIAKLLTNNLFIYTFSILIVSFGLFCISRVILIGVDRTYFEFKPAMHYVFIFSLGFVFGKPLIGFISNNAYRVCSGIGALSIVVVYSMYKVENEFINALWLQVALVSFSVFTIIVAQCINGSIVSRLFSFYGINSLIVLGLHGPVLALVQRVIFKLRPTADNAYGFVSALITILTLYFIILFLNKHIPVVVGKKPLFKFS